MELSRSNTLTTQSLSQNSFPTSDVSVVNRSPSSPISSSTLSDHKNQSPIQFTPSLTLSSRQRPYLRTIELPRLKRRKHPSSSSLLINHPKISMASCALGGHLDSPTDLRDVLGTMISDPQLHSLCDVVLVVQGERFMAHRAVLAAASCVFKAMFTNCMKERDAPEITLSSIDKHAWRMVMQYIYNAQVDLDNDDDALVLLSTARMYQLERLESFVETFLVGRVNITNALRLVDTAERYDMQLLREECFANMEREFESMALSPAFLCCPVHVITRLLSSGELVFKSELMVFESVIRWIAADGQRKVFLEKLLSLVRLERMADAEVKEMARHSLVRGCWRLRERVFDRLVSSSSDFVTERALSGRNHLKTRRRDASVFTFAHTQRGMIKVPNADQEEVVRTPWSMDGTGKRVWRLKIYPQGYSRAKGQYLSMYVQARSTNKAEPLNVSARFDIFLVNQKEESSLISFSSQHHFLETSDHWGFHRFLQLSNLVDTNLGYLDDAGDSVVVGANIYFSS